VVPTAEYIVTALITTMPATTIACERAGPGHRAEVFDEFPRSVRVRGGTTGSTLPTSGPDQPTYCTVHHTSFRTGRTALSSADEYIAVITYAGGQTETRSGRNAGTVHEGGPRCPLGIATVDVGHQPIAGKLEQRATNADHRVGIHRCRLADPLAVDISAIGASEVHDLPPTAPLVQLRVLARDQQVIEHNVVVRQSPDSQARR